MTHKEILISPTDIVSLFYGVDVALDLSSEVQLLDMEYENKLQTFSQ